jgi:hypothetical protein
VFSTVPVEGNWKLTFEGNFEGDKPRASKQIPNYEWGQMHYYYACCDPADVFIDKGTLWLQYAHTNAQPCLKRYRCF